MAAAESGILSKLNLSPGEILYVSPEALGTPLPYATYNLEQLKNLAQEVEMRDPEISVSSIFKPTLVSNSKFIAAIDDAASSLLSKFIKSAPSVAVKIPSSVMSVKYWGMVVRGGADRLESQEEDLEDDKKLSEEEIVLLPKAEDKTSSSSWIKRCLKKINENKVLKRDRGL